MAPSFLCLYKSRIDEQLPTYVSAMGEKTPLRDTCEYALLNGGKRLRPAIALMVADALGNGLSAWPVGLAVELFHTASLIADDLPCMDNDDERRNKPTTHRVFGEAMALLASYALIASGYREIYNNAVLMAAAPEPFYRNADHACSLCLENATRNTGLQGATGGQFLDIFLTNLSEEQLIDVIKKKTVSLFEIAFVGGWLFGGGDLALLEQVIALACHFGVAFQIADDLDDISQDSQKSVGTNYALLQGVDQALERCRQEINAYLKLLQELKLDSPALIELGSAILVSAERYAALHGAVS